MPIVITCPGCDKKMRAPDTAAGKKIRCPGCGELTPVPRPAPALDEDERPEPPRGKKAPAAAVTAAKKRPPEPEPEEEEPGRERKKPADKAKQVPGKLEEAAPVPWYLHLLCCLPFGLLFFGFSGLFVDWGPLCQGRLNQLWLTLGVLCPSLAFAVAGLPRPSLAAKIGSAVSFNVLAYGSFAAVFFSGVGQGPATPGPGRGPGPVPGGPVAQVPGEWREYISADGACRAQMPGTPEDRSQPVDTETGTGKSGTVRAEFNGGAVYYSVVYHDMPFSQRAKHSGENLAELEARVQPELLASLPGARAVTKKEAVLEGGYNGREFSITGSPEASIYCRLFRVEGRLFQVIARVPPGEGGTADAIRFLDSFRIHGKVPEPTPKGGGTKPPPTGPFRGHTGEWNWVDASPTEDLLATASSDKTIKLWDVQTGKDVGTLKGHTNDVLRVAFSRDGKLLASGSGGEDHRILLWDVEKREQKPAALTVNHKTVTALAFSPDGKYLASANWEEVRLWDVATGTQVAPFRFRYQVNGLVFSPDGKTLYLCGDREIQPIDIEKRQLLPPWKDSAVFGEFRALALRPDGKVLACGSWANTRLWDTATGKVLPTLTLNTNVTHVSISPDGKYLTTWDDKVKVWDLTTGSQLATVAVPGYGRMAVFAAGGRKLAVMHNGGLVVHDLAEVLAKKDVK
jgi:WD40 repeat protein